MKIFLVLILALAISLPAQARMGSTNYEIPSLTISSGGDDKSTSTNYDLQDMKGQGVIGLGNSTNYEGQLGGIYGTLKPTEEAPPGPPITLISVVDTGRIRGTWIERLGDASGSNIRLHWDYDSHGPCPVNIYVKVGGEFSTDPADYLPLPVALSFVRVIMPLPSTQQSITIPGVVRNGHNYYFRVVPDPLVGSSTIMDDTNNSITVAKIDIPLVRKLNLISVPMFYTSASGAPETLHIVTSLEAVIGNQLEEKSSVYAWNMTDLAHRFLDKASYISLTAGFDKNFELVPGLGYWIYRPLTAPATSRATLVGIVQNTDYASRIEYGLNSWAYPYPIEKDITAVNFSPGDGDAFYDWISSADPQYLEKYSYSTSWPTGAARILIDRGYWYYRKGDSITHGFDWTETRP
jgi:hypothetical protein